jgi:hypothetical protein
MGLDDIFVNRIKKNKKTNLFNKAMRNNWSYKKFKKEAKKLK